MKKIIGILGVAVIAVTMFFNTNNASDSGSDVSLASLMNMNIAYATGEYSCSATAGCPNNGSVSCTGSSRCSSGIGYVTCDGHSSSCTKI